MTTLTITPRLIVAELKKRGIKAHAEVIGGTSVVTFEWHGVTRRIIGMIAEFQNASAQRICDNKVLAQRYLEHETTVTLPAMELYKSNDQAHAFMQQHGIIVVKPIDSGHGNGITTDVVDERGLQHALEAARPYSKSGEILLQAQVVGSDVRILVIDGHAAAAVYRIPAEVTGDGEHTLRELIEIENATNVDRGDAPYVKPLNKIDLDAATRFLGERMDQEIPSRAEVVQVVGTSNIGTGGKSVECLSELPDTMIRDAEDAARAVGAFCCGVDFLYDKQKGTHNIIEINAAPSFGLHANATIGARINIAARYVDALLSAYDAKKDGQ